MSILDPSVIVETVINQGFSDLLTDVNTQIPLILSQFPQDYINDAIAYLTDPKFTVTTIFQYAYDPNKLPAWNIVLSNENEAAGNQQMYLNDIVDNGEEPGAEFEEKGSDWVQKVNVYIRAQKDRQCIILYNLTKWIFLKNRLTFEEAGFKVPVFTGSDIMYEKDHSPTFVFTRMLSVNTRALQTVDIDISGDPLLSTVDGVWPNNVQILGQSQVARE